MHRKKWRDARLSLNSADTHNGWHFDCGALAWRGYEITPLINEIDLWDEAQAMSSYLYKLRNLCNKASGPSRFFSYQLGHIPAVWDPFFPGSPTDPKNGTEEVITSALSKAFPLSDAALGGYTYLLEILTGLVGAKARWRTMPWLVVLFGLMIAPLGITSIAFVIIQPIVIGTLSTVALIGAAAILIQIPYSLDELIATCQFVRRRMQAGRNGFAVFFRGDTDTMPAGAHDSSRTADEFNQSAGVVLRNMLAGGVNLPWNLGLAALIGLALLFTRLWPGVDGNLAHAHHVIGSLVLTVVSIAAAEVARSARWLNLPLGAGLMVVPIVFAGDAAALLVSLIAGAALMALSIRRGADTRALWGVGPGDCLIEGAHQTPEPGCHHALTVGTTMSDWSAPWTRPLQQKIPISLV